MNTIANNVQTLHAQKSLIEQEIKRKLTVLKIVSEEFKSYDEAQERLQAFQMTESAEEELLSNFLQRVNLLLKAS